MQAHSAQRILMMLLIALLMGVVAAPADAKRPRRYEDVYLTNWEICPQKATLTIGTAAAGETVNVDAQHTDTLGTSLIESGPQLNVPLDEATNQLIDYNELADDELADEDPLLTGEQETINFQKILPLVWSRRVPPGSLVRISLFVQFDPRWARFRVDTCEPSPPPGGGNSSGVTTPGTPLSTDEIRELSKEIGTNSEAGSGLGGSQIPRAQCTIAGTPGSDRIEGTRGNDVICGFGGNDVIDGAGGLDVIDGADGDDRVNGGSGNDELLLGLRGNDRLNGNGGDDRASGGAGDDRVRGSSGNDFLGGGSGDDRLTGGKDRDRIRGGPGADRINARDRTRDTVHGGSGLDSATVDRPGGGRGVTGGPTKADRVRGIEQLQ